MTRRRAGRYGNWGKHIELFEMFDSWRRDPDAMQRLAESEGWEDGTTVQEGTGAPEGRADFPLFLLTTFHHRMRQGFRRRASKWDTYVGIERAEDFRQHTVSQLNGITGMREVPEYGEYERLRSAEEEGPPFAVGKHGGVYGVTFEMTVNDEANVILNRTPTEMGRMSAAYVSLLVAALIEANANWIDGIPFFSSTPRAGLPSGNEFTGAGAEPTEDNIVTMMEQMDNMVDAEGFPMDYTPGRVLTRSHRVRLAFKRIDRSQETGVQVTSGVTGTSIEKGTINPLQGDSILPGGVVQDSYLKDPNDFILFAEVERPAFIVAFLRDQREPRIWLHDSGMRGQNGAPDDAYSLDYDEILYKIRHVLGVAQGDPRAAIRARRS